jgi:hypothetical protein
VCCSQNLELDILNTIKAIDGISPQGVLEYLFQSEAMKAQSLPYLWGMLARGKVGYDSNEKLSMNTQLWVWE